MNIKITYDWLLEYLDTDADPYELQKYLSLCGPSVETVEKIGDSYVLDIEITSNRIDMASVFGIAQEAQAILPQFGKKAVLTHNPLTAYTFENMNAEPIPSHKLSIRIQDPDLCSRFTAFAFSDVQINPSPAFISNRLELCGIRSINNVIDISNYLMLSLGQPTHMFDLDQIKGNSMLMRRSKKGERMITLDGKELTLPGDDIVIEDGEGRIIDLCGIMGGENSAITENTTNILFFVQTYHKSMIRRTSMTTGQRSIAATYFEKGLDPERVEPTMVWGVELLGNITKGIPKSELIDIYPHPAKQTHVKVYLQDIHRLMGVIIPEKTIVTILNDLGFLVVRHENEELAYPDGVYFQVTIPSFRRHDIQIREDIIEEVARVYGYHRLPSVISPMVHIKQPRDTARIFQTISRIKHFLKHLGFHEFLNYSMVSGELLKKLSLDPNLHLHIANTISAEIEYMRRSLIPSLVQNIKNNQGKSKSLNLFEIAKTYIPKRGELPEERYKLGIGTFEGFLSIKGVIESLARELVLPNPECVQSSHEMLATGHTADIQLNGKPVGSLGLLKRDLADKMGIGQDLFVAELDLHELVTHILPAPRFTEPHPFAVIKLDITIPFGKKNTFAEMKNVIMKSSHFVQDIEVLSKYESNITLRIYFSDHSHNLTEEEAKQELSRITQALA